MFRFPILLFLTLAACHEAHAPAPTAEESARLDEADQELDNLAVNEQGAGNEQGPADRSTGP